MEPAWAVNLPRLYDLYRNSDITSATNYFNKFELVLDSPYARTQYEELEQNLQQLADNAWQELKQKALKHVDTKHTLRAWEQLFNTLSEVKGYLYLKSEGCKEIQFIPKGNTPTPDLYGQCGSTGILLEVKAINPFDIDLQWIKANSELHNGRMTAREVQTGLPVSLKRKITNGINAARKQLMSYPYKRVNRRIAYLVIKLDIGVTLDSRNFNELEAYMKQLDNEQIEVKYCFRGWQK
jgi:hypothetical protein